MDKEVGYCQLCGILLVTLLGIIGVKEKKTNTGIRLRENERNEKSKCRWYFQICFKGEKRNREVVGEGCGSRKSFLFFSFFFLYEEYYTIFTMDGSSFVI